MVLHLSLDVRESAESSEGVVNDLVSQGLKVPQLIISDGNTGLLRAVQDIWPQVARQRCVVHRVRNVLARVPKKRQPEVKKALNPIFDAACLDDARDEARSFLSRYGRGSSRQPRAGTGQPS